MCFSPEASFAAGAVLVPAGAFCIRAAWLKNKAYLPLAMVPLLFAVQQLCEGVVWLGFGRDDDQLVKAASVVYLFFALPLWPFWIPFCAFFVEPRKMRKSLLGCLTILGLVWTWIYLPIALAPGDYLETKLVHHSTDFLGTQMVHHSIEYDVEKLPAFADVDSDWWTVAYFLAVATALLMFCVRPQENPISKAVSIGAALALPALFAICWFVYWYAFASVWCFFAAILSLFLCLVFYRLPARRLPPPVGLPAG